MADWDPFAIDEASAPAAAPSAAAAGGSSGTKGRMTKEQLDVFAKLMTEEAINRAPWFKVPDPTPDLSWYTPTCTFEDWKHTDVKIEEGQAIVYIKLNRPDNNNFLTASSFTALADAVFALHARKDIRCAVFCAEGKLFCGGSDPKFDGNFVTGKQTPKVERTFAQLKERAIKAGALEEGNSEGVGRLLQAKLWFTMATVPQFSISLVQGSVVGDGMGLVACTDMVIATKNSYFSFPEVQGGSAPCILAPWIVQKVGSGFAKYMVSSGMNFGFEEMQRAGLINEQVSSAEEGHDKICQICEVLTACGPRSVEAAKQLVVGVGGKPIGEGVIFFTAALLAMVTVSDESRDGMVCLQMRKPKPWEEPHAIIKPLYGKAPEP